MVILSGQEYLDESGNILTTNTMNQDGNLFQVSHLAEENIQNKHSSALNGPVLNIQKYLKL